jgi:hypothetical protein
MYDCESKVVDGPNYYIFYRFRIADKYRVPWRVFITLTESGDTFKLKMGETTHFKCAKDLQNFMSHSDSDIFD